MRAKLEWESMLDAWQLRPVDSHKGDFGHTLVVGGDYGMTGAVRLAALGALRVGSGLTTIASRVGLASTLNMIYPEIMSHGVSSMGVLHHLIEKSSVIVLGPGLGDSRWSKKLFKAVIQANRMLVVDADALTLLSQHPIQRDDWVLTPHPGEAARLLKCRIDEIQHDRVDAAQKIQQKFGGVVVLKGARTVVCDSMGGASICEAGNPGMASGGMGDLLSGMIGGLIAQGLPFIKAASIAVGVHARAGDLVARQGQRGMIASDLVPFIRKLMNQVSESEI